MSNNVSTLPLIDTSASMGGSGYGPATVIAAKAYLRSALPGDRIGVCNFDTSGRVAYPATGGQLATVDRQLTVTKAAADVVDRLRFNGNSTNIGDGIVKARSLVDPSTSPKGFVLLSDGYHNHGTDPLSVLPTGYPIYSCALGPSSDQALLRKISERTQGHYHYAPTPIDMMKIFNEIRGQAPHTGIVANTLTSIPRRDYLLLPAIVAADHHLAQFGVVWKDPAFSYTPEAPGEGQLRITLVDPKGDTRRDPPTVVGHEHVIFNVSEPEHGRWFAQVEHGGSARPLDVTVGVFEFHDRRDGGLDLVVDVPAHVRPGEPLALAARVTDGGEPCTGVEAHVRVEKPVVGVPRALELYRHRLDEVEPAEEDLARGMPEELARLAALHDAEPDVLPVQRRPLALARQADGEHVTTLDNTSEAGSYNLQVVVTGRAPGSGTPFQRSRWVSVLVD